MKMLNPKTCRKLLPFIHTNLTSRYLSTSPALPRVLTQSHSLLTPTNQNPNLGFKNFHFSFAANRLYSTDASTETENTQDVTQSDSGDEVSPDEVEPIELWEEEDETEPKIGDGGNGGGVVLQNCPWGAKVLSIAKEVLLQYGDDIEIFAFKTSPGGYIYVRLDRLCNEYGCPSLEDIKSYNHEFKKRLDDAGAAGDIPNDLAVEVSSPGADRLLRIPDDLQRFKEMAMRVAYVEDDNRAKEKEGVFFLESSEAGSSVWRLADVKENRDPLAKGRPMTRKRKDWRLALPHQNLKMVTLYLDYE